jgi:TM2 domain-containing membrane protein YozV
MNDMQKMMQYEASKKSAGIAYLLWFLFGILGTHRLYLGDGKGLLIPCLIVLGFFMGLGDTGAFGLFLIVAGVGWWFIDLFLIPYLAQQYNQKLAASLSE